MLRAIFNRVRTLVRQTGPATIYAQKTRIVFLTRVRFAAAYVHPAWLEITLWLTDDFAHTALYRIENLRPAARIHHFRLNAPGDADAAFTALLRRAYRAGRHSA